MVTDQSVGEIMDLKSFTDGVNFSVLFKGSEGEKTTVEKTV